MSVGHKQGGRGKEDDGKGVVKQQALDCYKLHHTRPLPSSLGATSSTHWRVSDHPLVRTIPLLSLTLTLTLHLKLILTTLSQYSQTLSNLVS
jgi:hypothetical protein